MECFIDVEKARRRRAMTTVLTALIDAFRTMSVRIIGLRRTGRKPCSQSDLLSTMTVDYRAEV
jgi:hypothetical protein